MPISKTLYEAIRQRARCRCEYCHYPELLSSAPLSIDHIQPQSLGGDDDPENLLSPYSNAVEAVLNRRHDKTCCIYWMTSKMKLQ